MRPGEGSFITAILLAIAAVYCISFVDNPWVAVVPGLLAVLFFVLANEAANEALEDADNDPWY